jgi:hypothetical protein
MKINGLVVSACVLGAAAAAQGQMRIDWYVIAGGGSTVPSTGGIFSVAGTIGQAGAGTVAGGNFVLSGGFWQGAGGGAACYANCDQSTVQPLLNVEDFTCFVNAFALAQALPHGQQVTHYANCDGSTVAPALNVEDFTCFINAFALGCP